MASIPSSLKNTLKPIHYSLATRSIRAAVAEQGLGDLYSKLEKIIPDLSGQFSDFVVDTDYLRTKVRAQHAFQVFMIEQALGLVRAEKKGKINVVDIGDSSGAHLLYMKGLFEKEVETLSVNIDPKAVERIKSKGLNAVCMRAENLGKTGFPQKPDLLMSFEMLEHLHDPAGFLKAMSEIGCPYFLITIPYLARSRVGLHEVRAEVTGPHTPEATHIFELSPPDWKLLFKHSGWETVYEHLYLQYPKWHPLRAYAYPFKQFDFEGFYGVVLKANPTWKDRYTGW